MKKRILWLFYHTSLRNWEVPLLIDMGYEVFCPQKTSLFDLSTSISYKFDDSLSIPAEALEKLNQVDFHSHRIQPDIIQIINRYFDIAFCMLDCSMIQSLLAGFRGAIVLHTIGLKKDKSYTEILSNNYTDLNMLSRIKQAGERFWFAPSYDNIAEIEAPVLRNRTLICPIGMENAMQKDRWQGGDKRILFVSPQIKTDPYYEAVYKNFCNNFGDLPHVIGGAQLQPVPEDPTVTGFLSPEEHEYNITHLAAMFYHSQEPRHLHYHPLEAICEGMPLVYMSGGMLDYLGGKDLPGRCTTVQEARRKLKRLAAGDRSLIKKITASQKVLLKSFTTEYCRPYWEKALQQIEQSLPARDEATGEWDLRQQRKKKVAILMPNAYTGGVLDYSIRLTLDLKHEFEEHNDNVEVLFAYPENKVYENKNHFRRLKKEGISIRSFCYRKKSGEWMKRALQLAGYLTPQMVSSFEKEVSILDDGIADFSDCDYLILTADAGMISAPFLIMEPHAIVAHDYIQRYVPEVFSPFARQIRFINQKSAEYVLTTSKPTWDDAVQFAERTKEKVILTPLLLELMPEIKKMEIDQNDKTAYFLWSTNSAIHKNHLRALEALENYYFEGGTLDCYMTGANTHYFAPDSEKENEISQLPYIQEVRERIGSSKTLSQRIHVMGDMDKNAYLQILLNAAFVFHPGYGDNGNGTVMDAAGYGVPSTCSDYPAMRYLADFAGLSFRYFDPFEPEEITQALLDMERNYKKWKAKLPSRDVLQQSDYRAQKEKIYQIVKDIIGI